MKRFECSRTRSRGFTLMELLVVISIMVLLAGLTIGTMSYVSEKQAIEQAKIQVNLLEMALEDYNSENGEYPSNPRRNGDKGTNKVFKALFPNSQNEKVYLAELDPGNDTLNWIDGSGSSATIIDPWGEEYRYRTNRSTGSTTITANPGFDLWSCGPDGETEPGSDGNYDPKHPLNVDDVRSW